MSFEKYLNILLNINNGIINNSVNINEKIQFYNDIDKDNYIKLSLFDIVYKMENRILLKVLINNIEFNINDNLVIYYLDMESKFNVTNIIPIFKQFIYNKDYEIIELILKRDDINININDVKYTSLLSWVINSPSYDKKILNMILGYKNTILYIPDVNKYMLDKISLLNNFDKCCYNNFYNKTLSKNLIPYVSKCLYSSDLLSLIILINDSYYKIIM